MGVKAEKSGNILGKLGAFFPIVSINGQFIEKKYIKKLEIESIGLYPTIEIVFEAPTPNFLTDRPPLDDDKLSVFLRSKNSKLLPLHLHFSVVSLETNKFSAKVNSPIIIIQGILYIHKFYNQVSYGFRENSYEFLKDLAKRLKLGFASNIDQPSLLKDKMTWLSIDRYHEAIEDVTAAAWRDDEHFYTSFIDVYYHLNFIELENIIGRDTDEKPKKGEFILSAQSDVIPGKEAYDEYKFQTLEIFISNTNFIDTFEHFTDAVTIEMRPQYSKLNGYREDTYWFDDTAQTATINEAESLLTEKSENEWHVMKGRQEDENWKNEIHRRWSGIQYSEKKEDRKFGNVHENYYRSISHNKMNNEEIKKFTLKVHLRVPNFNFYRGQRLLILFTIHEHEYTNHFLSGWYLIKGITWVWNRTGGKMEMILQLFRREHPTHHTASRFTTSAHDILDDK